MTLQRNSATFGADLLAIRTKLKLSRHEFAKLIGMSSSDSIRRYEENGVKPQMDIFLRINGVLDEYSTLAPLFTLEDATTQDMLIELTNRGFKVTLEQQR